MKSRISIFAVLGLVAMLGAMIACGGGGSSSESISYTGETMPSVLDTTGAVELARGSVLDNMEMESPIGTDLFPLAVSESDTLEDLLDPEVAAGILINALTGGPAASAVATPGSPAGSAPPARKVHIQTTFGSWLWLWTDPRPG